MLADSDIKEELSRAYLIALAASIGCTVECIQKDRFSIDAVVRAHGRLVPGAIFDHPCLEIQLKATSTIRPVSGYLPLRVPIKNYNDLRAARTYQPKLLVVLQLPDKRGDWIEHCETNLALRRCAYWYSLRGAPAATGQSKTVKVPLANVLTPKALRKWLEKAACGESIL